MTTLEQRHGLPGMSDIFETVEKQIFWGRRDANIGCVVPTILDGAARDSANSPTTLLRPGLLLGQNSTTKKDSEWDPTATDGTEIISGVLLYAEDTQRNNANEDKWFGYKAVAGQVKAASLIVPGTSTYGLSGNALEHYAKNMMANLGFKFDDSYHQSSAGFEWKQIKTVTTSTTVTADDDRTLFIVNGSGAITMTLPDITKSKGLKFGFRNIADQNMIIASAVAGDLIGLGNAAADTVTFSTSSQKIGAAADVLGIDNASYFVDVIQGTGTVA
jgi:hypothetical protein